MRPNQCVACQGRDLYHTFIEAENKGGVVIRLGLSGRVAAKCSVCLSCGHIAPYLDSGELDTVRAWKKKARKVRAKKAKSAVAVLAAGTVARKRQAP